MRKIAVMSTKGGTGKTSVAVNLSHALSILGKKVLLIDTDPQDTVSVIFAINPQKTFEDLLISGKTSIIKVREGLHVVGSGGVKLTETDRNLSKAKMHEFILKKNLANVKNVDYIIFDCSSSVSNINFNVLTYTNELIIPVSMRFLSQAGIALLMDFIKLVKQDYNKKLDILGVLANFYDINDNITKKSMDIYKGHFKDKMFDTHIRTDKNIYESPEQAKTVLEYNPDSFGAIDFMKLAEEVEKRYK